MTNADKFKAVFGMYSEEFWAKPEQDMLSWINSEYQEPQTNADRIRSMTDEELAEFLDRWALGDIDYSKTFCDLCKGQYDCHDDCLMDWLKEEAKDV